jgi:ubiquinone/menaquinone biosynthesis C-methylase UbiE
LEQSGSPTEGIRSRSTMRRRSHTDRAVERAYEEKAADYDRSVKAFALFARMGFNLSEWRRRAIAQLQLKPGDTVVDIGCGTGLNFPFLQELVGPEGRIIGIDRSPEMLAVARRKADDCGWGEREARMRRCGSDRLPEERGRDPLHLRTDPDSRLRRGGCPGVRGTQA